MPLPSYPTVLSEIEQLNRANARACQIMHERVASSKIEESRDLIRKMGALLAREWGSL